MGIKTVIEIYGYNTDIMDLQNTNNIGLQAFKIKK